MLDRILNINTNEKYKSGTKVPTTQFYAINRHEHDRHNSKDSALFSPLAKLLSKINWTILNVDYPSNDEILLHFLVEDLEFMSIIHYSEMYSDSYQDFNITRVMNNSGINMNYKAAIKVEKENIGILDNPDPIIVDNLKIMFQRMLELNPMNETKIIESENLSGVTFNIEKGLLREMNYILKVIYTFISTKNKSRIKNNFILKSSKNIPMIIEKVAIKYAE